MVRLDASPSRLLPGLSDRRPGVLVHGADRPVQPRQHGDESSGQSHPCWSLGKFLRGLVPRRECRSAGADRFSFRAVGCKSFGGSTHRPNSESRNGRFNRSSGHLALAGAPGLCAQLHLCRDLLGQPPPVVQPRHSRDQRLGVVEHAVAVRAIADALFDVLSRRTRIQSRCDSALSDRHVAAVARLHLAATGDQADR